MESVLLEDNPHWENSAAYDRYIRREKLDLALQCLEPREVLAILGARRVGKSSLARLLIRELLPAVPPRNIFFINLEKPLFIPHKTNPAYLDTIYEAYLKIAEPDLSQRIYVFLDEIQVFAGWEIFVKSRYESSFIKFVITGSNSSLLQSSYATALTGRVLKLYLSPFNFREYLTWKQVAHRTKLEQVRNKIAIKRAVDEYLRWGGYHSVFTASEVVIKRELIKNIAEDIIFKDIVPRLSIKHGGALRDLFAYIVSNTATTLNYTSLGNKLSMDPKTIKEYVDHLEDNFLLQRVPRYHTKLTAQINSARKVYLSDNGFLNLGVSAERNLGAMLENAVNVALQEYQHVYLLENKECDFYANGSLYQVAYHVDDEATLRRELQGLHHFMCEFGLESGTIVTYDRNETRHIEDKTVEFVSIENFLLSGVT
ncbi:ATP-binding protein [Chrysiogenes arsenatis]|uniref:ATP-binding protein n=1 Tax=Chrysiogenes arsenatis TaxID=309797 RepID=UPI0003F8BAC4|nr:ATP-binding protein [Chrysiogenes arsenatis]